MKRCHFIISGEQCFVGFDLIGFDLIGFDLIGFDLIGIDLIGIDLRFQNLVMCT